METVRARLRSRLVPALLASTAITLIVAGLLTYVQPIAGEGGVLAERSSLSAAAVITFPPLAPSTPHASPDPRRFATRVRIAELGIDLPVVKATAGYPPCDVALSMAATGLRQPGLGRATYLYAHARPGMFLPLLETPETHQRGLRVEVWTSDDFLYVYQIVDVRHDQDDLAAAQAATHEQLWLQTSEGPTASFGKTQVVAEFVSVEPATHPEAHPKARPKVC
jgi:hypothetical protein